MAQHTAIEQFIEWISSDCTPLDCVMKAKELLKTEREQHSKTFEAGNKRGWSGYPNTDNWTQPTFEQYWNKTYLENDGMIGVHNRLLEKIDKNIEKIKKQIIEQDAFEIFKAGQESMEEGGKSFEQYYKEKEKLCQEFKEGKTSVEWLEHQLKEKLGHIIRNFDYKLIESLFDTAKEIDMRQKKECWNAAHQAGRFEGKGIAKEGWQTFEQYISELKNSI